MNRSISPLIGLALTLSMPAVWGADLDMCASVPVEDVESALAIKVTNQRKGPRKCNWSTSDPTIHAEAGYSEVRKDAKLEMKAYVAAMKQMGQTIAVTDDTQTLWCAQIKGPNVAMAQCRAIANGRDLDVAAAGASMTSAKVKSFVSKVIARLP